MDAFEHKLQKLLRRGVAGQQGAIVDAGWLEPHLLAGPEWRYRNAAGHVGGLVLGYRNEQSIGSDDNRHVMTVAGSRGGKGVSLIVPNLLLYEGSVLAIDPKGELSRITARARREKGQKVIILDPFPDDGAMPQGKFNPLDELDPASKLVRDDAGVVADALIIPSEHEPHWTDSARILVRNLILYTLTLPRKDRHLITVWRLLDAKHPSVLDVARRGQISNEAALFKLMEGCKDVFDGSVSSAGHNFAKMGEKERQSILSSARTQLNFLDSGGMTDVLTGSDFKLSDLKSQKTTLYLCLPANRMGTHSRWLRVIINLALIAFERTRAKTDIPALMVLDEFAVLGHMRSIEVAAGLMAGFGLKLWVVVQDLGQIKRLYKDSWETFIGNTGVVTFWSNSDKFTLDYVSDKLGQTNVRIDQPSNATANQKFGGTSGVREEMRVQRLAPPHELERLLDRRQQTILVLAAGQPPVVLERIVYYDDSNFVGQFDE